MATSRTKPAGRTAPTGDTVRFSRQNWLILGAALLAIGLGFFLLSTGSTALAPLLLVLGYVVLIPLGIIR